MFADGQGGKNLTLRVVRTVLVAEAVFAHLGVKRRASQAEQFGRVGLVAFGPSQGLCQQHLFDLLEKLLVGAVPDMRTEVTLHNIQQPLVVQARGLRRRALPAEFYGKRQVSYLDGVATAVNHRSLDAVLKFANIARPRVVS